MIPRQAQITVERLARGFPVVAVTGPRQSGKTTLARAVFSNKPYVSLENPDEREFATQDPKRFLARFGVQGAVIDEIQRCPELLSWLQGVVDERQLMGDFVITGSAQFELVASISQSLAGRVGRVELLPLSLGEIRAVDKLPSSLGELLLRGGYPALYVRDISPEDWFTNYIATYVERDVRQLIAVRDLGSFQTFVRMCAARTGQLLNVVSLAADCGISASAAKQWLTVLQASYIITLLRPHHQNFGKRMVKSPKLYFLDAGLASWLLGIRDAQTLMTHAARGALFETWVVAELHKQRLNQGATADLYFWRDSGGHEIDVLFETADRLVPFEVKSGCTFASDWLTGLKKWQAISGTKSGISHLVYGGSESYKREGVDVHSWRDMGSLLS
ncbi:ATP-binding protein [Orrella daihaiensis]|uniref:ATP-binding protein n=1 Tax=Orrella daihaiensis TaxID=2782176 RepID=A0ABY4AJ31_9BURK|nr:ATP-binding protein [Orrella daihaiensis]UOD49661.1 ATP-binding protein [Orrella daihaiensis]